ncbi:MAG: FkbM family methyltransferase [Armatimonadetes bacterium CSP1-3]|nr:MAG: FkbM family methyltransferase [Armatimonadetes bacterium CSP1-3]
MPRPHFIKIDVEGAEAAVLRGGLETLRTARPVVAAELHTAANAAEAAGLLSAAGYQVRVVEDREATRCLIVATPEG